MLIHVELISYVLHINSFSFTNTNTKIDPIGVTKICLPFIHKTLLTKHWKSAILKNFLIFECSDKELKILCLGNETKLSVPKRIKELTKALN